MAIPIIDLGRQYAQLKTELDAAVLGVYDHGRFILGPEVGCLEAGIAQLSGVEYGIGVASGTDALLLALHACGVGPGDEVITANFSFFASAGVVTRLGARPVFVDTEEDSFNLDPTLLEAAITEKTKAIVPVHLFGQLADMDPIMEIARRHNIRVVEDAAQSVGAEYKGRPAGSIGDLGCFSFFPTKNLGGSGDGGMIVTADKELYELCKMLRTHGEKPKYYHRIVGYNSRLDTLQAATLLVKLPHLREWSEARVRHAQRYDRELADLPHLTVPKVMPGSTFHIYNQYTLRSRKREEIIAGLREREIGVMIYYPVPFHQQECFADLGYAADAFPVSTAQAETVFSIPVYPELTDDEQGQVIAALRELAA